MKKLLANISGFLSSDSRFQKLRMTEEIKNRVSESGLIEFNLEDYFPQGNRILIDVKDNLFQGLILREKDFREYVKNENWKKYEGAYAAITCTADAVVPTWAYMLLTTALSP